MIGKKILHYNIVKKLGEGGMGVVYLAEDTRLDRQVAIKFLPGHIATDTEARQRFEIEAKAAASLNHPNIATIHAIEHSEDHVFIVMEYITGKELQQLAETSGTDATALPIDNAIDIAIQIAKGLQAAHEKGIVHRDIKSGNIMLTDKGQVKIMDFGLAKIGTQVKLTQVGSTLGTAAYMSPEQAQGEPVDHRSDLWSMGVVFYELLTGHLPFKGDYSQAVIYSILNEKAESVDQHRVDVPKLMVSIIEKLLQKNPTDRYPNADAVLADLERANRQTNSFSRSQPIPSTVKPEKSQINKQAILSTLFISILVTGIVLWSRYTGQTSDLPNYELNSIAVLPFTDLSQEQDQEYFCDGMTEEILTKLARLGELKVIARTSVMRYRNTEKSIREIGDELDVATVLEGSVRKHDNTIRVTAQLIRTDDESHIWADSYDKKIDDLFALQDDVALSIAQALHVQLTPTAINAIEENGNVDTRLYELVKRGNHLLFSKLEREKALEYYKEALQIDSTYAPACIGVTMSWHQKWVLSGFRDREALKRKLVWAEKSIRLAPDNPEALAALAHSYLTSKVSIDSTYEALQHALDANPNSEIALEATGFFYISEIGLWDAGLKYFEKATSVDPFSIKFYTIAASNYIDIGEFDKAREIIEDGRELSGDYILGASTEAILAVFNNNFDLADSLAAVAESFNPNFGAVAKAYVFAARGEAEKALALHKDEQIYLLLNMPDEALTLLETYAEHPTRSLYQYLTRFPLFKKFSDNPRFQQLVEKEKLKLAKFAPKYQSLIP
ncbi:MAG: protein kinase [Calditrichaeota bacterium]|nr:protein kinase [Calditrichota bacterium]MCB0268159.1 protein kinase [Calditrichota bacterium]